MVSVEGRKKFGVTIGEWTVRDSKGVPTEYRKIINNFPLNKTSDAQKMKAAGCFDTLICIYHTTSYPINTYQLKCYLTMNTLCPHYENKPVTALYGNSICLLSESYEKRK
jgi:hypothetical protein